MKNNNIGWYVHMQKLHQLMCILTSLLRASFDDTSNVIIFTLASRNLTWFRLQATLAAYINYQIDMYLI